VGCFSFFPTKNLGAFGDGGAIACRDQALASRIRRLRQYGWDDQRDSVELGMNSRLDELQAAILRVMLRHLDAGNDERRAQAARYRAGLSGTAARLPPERVAARHVYHLFVIRASERDSLVEHLERYGVATGIHYPRPVHLMPAFRGGGRLPITEQIANEIVSLPLYPGLDAAMQARVISAIAGYFHDRAGR
jgi:dTDP-4-amino-4,6-dideoxygalactose transaminase